MVVRLHHDDADEQQPEDEILETRDDLGCRRPPIQPITAGSATTTAAPK